MRETAEASACNATLPNLDSQRSRVPICHVTIARRPSPSLGEGLHSADKDEGWMEERINPVSLRFLFRGWITRTPIAHRDNHDKHRNTENAAFFCPREHPLGIARYEGASCSAAVALC